MNLKAILEKLDELDPKYHDLYSERDGKFYLNPIEGMKSEADVLRLQTSLAKERNEHKETKTKLEAFAGMEPSEVLSKLDRIAELEEAAKGKLNDEQINQIVETRIKARLAPLERELNTTKAKAAELEQTTQQYVEKDRKQTIHSTLTKAANELKITDPNVIEDILMWSSSFKIDEDSNSVTTEDGLDPKAWLMNMQPKKLHWFGESVGAGTKTGNNGQRHVNPWSKATFNLTEQGRITVENPVLAEQLSKSAVR